MNRIKLVKILSICTLLLFSIKMLSAQFMTLDMIFEYGYVWGVLAFVILFFALATMIFALSIKEP